MTHAAAILRSVCRTTWLSLPPAVQKKLNGLQVRHGQLGHTAEGLKRLGIALFDGKTVALDSDALEELPESELEEILGHEFAHAFLRRCGIEPSDEPAAVRLEEAAVAKLTKSWGFRDHHGSNTR